MGADQLRVLLGTLGIPVETGAILGVWPASATGGPEVHLTPRVFWGAVKQLGPAVTSNEGEELLFPHRHRFAYHGVEFVTFSAEPVLPPGTLTPGFALRLT